VSISVLANRLGLTNFITRKSIVSEFVNVVNMDFGTEKMGKIYFVNMDFGTEKWEKFVCFNRVRYNRV
jgi:hypothetical protein